MARRIKHHEYKVRMKNGDMFEALGTDEIPEMLGNFFLLHNATNIAAGKMIVCKDSVDYIYSRPVFEDEPAVKTETDLKSPDR